MIRVACALIPGSCLPIAGFFQLKVARSRFVSLWGRHGLSVRNTSCSGFEDQLKAHDQENRKLDGCRSPCGGVVAGAVVAVPFSAICLYIDCGASQHRGLMQG
ncbi:unnamed protein product [Durusdinium trenchii]|uniref:Uncharacterized protein n=2 Tax=Durusdinium trenchii TaxID=1381693 RepID=A0ABP0M1S6_9DINO